VIKEHRHDKILVCNCLASQLAISDSTFNVSHSRVRHPYQTFFLLKTATLSCCKTNHIIHTTHPAIRIQPISTNFLFKVNPYTFLIPPLWPRQHPVKTTTHPVEPLHLLHPQASLNVVALLSSPSQRKSTYSEIPPLPPKSSILKTLNTQDSNL